MTRKEAARIYEELVSDLIFDQESVNEALKMGADALRRLDELEKWAEEKSTEASRGWDKTETPTWVGEQPEEEAYFEYKWKHIIYDEFLKALHGEMEWPGKE